MFSVPHNDDLAHLLVLTQTDSEHPIYMQVKQGQVLRIAAATWDGGPGTVLLALQLPLPPPNDRYSARQPVTGSDPLLRGTLIGTEIPLGDHEFFRIVPVR